MAEALAFEPWNASSMDVDAAEAEAEDSILGVNHKRAAVSLRYSPCGDRLAVASADKKCTIFDSSSSKVLTVLDGEHTVGLNDVAWLSESFVVTASDDKTVRVWDVEAGKVVSTCSGHKSFVFCVDVHPDTKLLYSGSYDGSIRVFHAPSNSTVMNFSGHAGAVVSLHINPQGEGREYVTGSHDGVCRIWDAATPSCCLRSTFSDSVPGISGARYSPNGEYILVSSLDHQLNLYPSRGDAPAVGAGAVKQYTGHVNSRFALQSCFYSPQASGRGNLVLQGSEDNYIYVWDVDQMNVVQRIAGHTDAVLAVASCPNANLCQVASAGRDSKVKFWRRTAS